MPGAAIPPRISVVASPRGPVADNLAAVVVNYNGWRDTVACIVSLLAGSVTPRWICVIDNASTDDSAARLASFLAGEAVTSEGPLPFGMPWRLALGDHDAAVKVIVDLLPVAAPVQARGTTPCHDGGAAVSLVFIVSPFNGGFAAGNNVGLRWLAQQGFEGFCWLVNSDACVAPDCVQALVEAGQSSGLPPLFGTVLVDHDQPQRVQACGARILGRSLKARSLHVGEPLADLQRRRPVQYASYPVGASMLFISRHAGRTVLLDERYFLYCEEPDLVRQFGLASVPIYTRAVVAHKGGAATGGSGGHTFTTDYYSIRARILYAWPDGPLSLAATTLHGALIAFKRLLTGRRGAGRNAWAALRDGLYRRGGPRHSS